MDSPTDLLGERLRPARRILVFTGAGISTGSGIPDFRGPSGLWTKQAPVYYDEFMKLHDKLIVNRGETGLDDLATLKLDEDVCEVLPPAVASCEMLSPLDAARHTGMMDR